jgi:hypothetical protein
MGPNRQSIYIWPALGLLGTSYCHSIQHQKCIVDIGSCKRIVEFWDGEIQALADFERRS